MAVLFFTQSGSSPVYHHRTASYESADIRRQPVRVVAPVREGDRAAFRFKDQKLDDQYGVITTSPVTTIIPVVAVDIIPA